MTKKPEDVTDVNDLLDKPAETTDPADMPGGDLLTEDELHILRGGEYDEDGKMIEIDPDAASSNEEDDADAKDKDDAIDPGAEVVTDPEPKSSEQPHQIPEGVKVGEELDAFVSAKEQEKSDLLDQFENGEIDIEQLKAKMADNDKETREAVKEAEKHTALAERQVQEQADNWMENAGKYMETYPGLKAQAVVKLFDAQIAAIGDMPQYNDLTDQQVLALAHKRLLDEADILGVKVPALGASDPIVVDPAKEDEKSKERVAKDGTVDAPRTISNIPAAGDNSPGGGLFAELDKLAADGNEDAYNAAMARLPQHQRDAYLESV